MMKIDSICLIMLFVLFSCNAQKEQQNSKAQDFYLTNTNTIEDFLKSGRSEGSSLDLSVNFLESLTGIKSYSIEEYSGNLYLPNLHNLEDWKKWYEMNKSNLVWNKNENKVTSTKINPLIKNPKEEYQRFLNIVKTQSSNDNINLDELNYAIDNLTDITNLTSIEYDYDGNENLPTKNMISMWDDWYSKNSNSLIWDSQTQSVRTKK